MKKVKSILFFLIVFVLIFPALQEDFVLFHPVKLNGYYQKVPDPFPVLSKTSFTDGSFCKMFNIATEENVSLRPWYIRLNNQIDYSLFSIPHAAKVVVGKNGQMFTTEYIHGYLGKGFMGKEVIDDKVIKLKKLQDYFWQCKGIFLFVLIPPDKGSFCPENIPERFLREKPALTGRAYFTSRCRPMGINLLDFNPWFMQMKDTCRYPLFPSTGVHWSEYGAYLAADSMIRYIEAGSKLKLARMELQGIKVTSDARHFDDDINSAMNLIWPARHEDLAYPDFIFKYDSGYRKPSALFIGDSFYWALHDQGIIRGLFRNNEFWYYDKEVYPETFTKSKPVTDLNLRQSLERLDIIVLIQVGAGSGNPGGGFIDRAYAEYAETINSVTCTGLGKENK